MTLAQTLSYDFPTHSDGVLLCTPKNTESHFILSSAAIQFVADLVRRFRPAQQELLAARRARIQERARTGHFDFLPETAHIRTEDWRAAPLPAALLDRRVEITGPVDRKMIINALNSGAKMFMADFEDSNTPTWDNQINGQHNLFDAIRRTISYQAPETGKSYSLNAQTATLLVRPRGLHLPEKHMLVDGEIATGSLVDFGFYFFHNAKELLERGYGPYFYLPKLEDHTEAAWWNQVFVYAQEKLGIPQKTIKATVLIETLPAAFQMDEIIYSLRDHMAGLNCGRWDYIFSYIKNRRYQSAALMPDRSQVTMEQPCMRAYTQLLIKTCHRRGVSAMGGMAAQIPIKNDAAANEAALNKVRADKLREVKDGHDGTWVAHPALVPIAMGIFDEYMPTANQFAKLRLDVDVAAADLLQIPTGTRTENGLRHNIRVGIQYIESWLRGNGCVPIYNLMEDAATAEICRTQVWQWLYHQASLQMNDGQTAILTTDVFNHIVSEEMNVIEQEVGEKLFTTGQYQAAKNLFVKLSTDQDYCEFLTLPAYEQVALMR